MSGATVLIVDDARLNREVLKLALAQGGYKILEADQGKAAIQMLTAHEVDLVMLDLMMPVMDGFQFLEWRQDNPPHNTVPVIVNSALDDFEYIQKALTMGSYDYFTKPLTEHDLRIILPLKIRNAIHSKRIFYELKNRNDRMQKEIELAGKYQRFLLPHDPRVAGVNLVTFYQSYIGVAGDFFDVADMDSGVGLIIADVSGHGLLSAMVSSLLKPLFERYINQTGSPAQTLALLNQDLLKLTREEDYVTAFCAHYDRVARRLTYSTAGHPDQLFFRRAENRVEALRTEGFFLGMFEAGSGLFDSTETSIDVSPGDRLLIFTDGPVEAFNAAHEQFGMARWRAEFQESCGLPPQEAAKRMWSRLMEHSSGVLSDDVAFIIAEFGEGDAGAQ